MRAQSEIGDVVRWSSPTASPQGRGEPHLHVVGDQLPFLPVRSVARNPPTDIRSAIVAHSIQLGNRYRTKPSAHGHEQPMLDYWSMKFGVRASHPQHMLTNHELHVLVDAQSCSPKSFVVQ